MLFLGDKGVVISNDSMKYYCFLHIQGGMSYDIKIIEHVLQETLRFLNVLNSSQANPSLCILGL